jgi:predicted Zn-ribbon and HTH transcriptional regulator
MHKLCEVDSPAMAGEILSRLDAESIVAEVTHTHSANLFRHVQAFRSQVASTIWIRDIEDLPRAAEIEREVRSIQMESEHCHRCGYDLEGHAGDGICPECGSEVTPVDDEMMVCIACGEENPVNFETCWSCGSVITGEDPRSGGMAPDAIPSRAPEETRASDRDRSRSGIGVLTWWLLGILGIVLLLRMGAL